MPRFASVPTVHLTPACYAVYKVTVSQQPTCTCPDAGKGNICKHLLFVMLRVLHLDNRDPVIWQRGLLSSELQHIWDTSEQRNAAGAVHTAVTADAALQAAYAASQADAASPGGKGPPERPVAGDCPICYDEMHPDGKSSAVSPAEAATNSMGWHMQLLAWPLPRTDIQAVMP